MRANTRSVVTNIVHLVGVMCAALLLVSVLASGSALAAAQQSNSCHPVIVQTQGAVQVNSAVGVEGNQTNTNAQHQQASIEQRDEQSRRCYAPRSTIVQLQYVAQANLGVMSNGNQTNTNSQHQAVTTDQDSKQQDQADSQPPERETTVVQTKAGDQVNVGVEHEGTQTSTNDQSQNETTE